MKRLAILLALLSAAASAQTVDVTTHVTLSHTHKASADASNVVLWLTPLSPTPAPTPHSTPEFTLTQKDKEFIPHLLVVPVGSNILFPNLDPFFHNVFSLFNGKRFDLGLYEGHTRRTVRFDREGVSYIFCNIHPDMGAVIITVATPYYAQSTPEGNIVIHGVPPGRYRLGIWAENVPADRLTAMSYVVQITADNARLSAIHLDASGDIMTHHENKFGEPYRPQPTTPY
jgi:plastocyanin